MINEIKKLLSRIQVLALERKAALEEKRKRGEDYNVFDVLGLGADEERLHSAFIANLLDPTANHGCRDLFLKRFLDHLATIHPQLQSGMATESARVSTEKTIGYLNEDCTAGGRIDILVESDGHAVIIENKIYAGDQTNQMLRYCHYATEHYNGQALVLYLTLDGHLPSDASTMGNLQDGIDYHPVSYAVDIVGWLNRCLPDCAHMPRIRECIIQYMELINNLTHNNMDDSFAESIHALLAQQPEAAATIFNSGLDGYLVYCFEHFVAPQLEQYASDQQLVFGSENMQSPTYKGFYLRRPEWKHYAIWFYLETTGRGWHYGVSNYNDVGDARLLKTDGLGCLFDPTDAWPLGSAWFQYHFWDGTTSADMINGKFTQAVVEAVEKVLGELDANHFALP